MCLEITDPFLLENSAICFLESQTVYSCGLTLTSTSTPLSLNIMTSNLSIINHPSLSFFILVEDKNL